MTLYQVSKNGRIILRTSHWKEAARIATSGTKLTTIITPGRRR